MKQFNLEEYLKDPSKKIVTREGLNAKIIYTEAKGKYPVIALIEDKYNKTESSADYTVDGKFLAETTNYRDLFFATEKHTGWVNVFKSSKGNNVITSDIFESKEEAEKAGKNYNNYIVTAKVEWEE